MKNNLQSFAENCVSQYAIYNDCDEFYSLQVSDLPDFVQHEFAALIMGNDEAHASEATGPDNPVYEKKMLPALLRHLKNSTDKDEEIEFLKEWQEGVTSYFHETMQAIIDELCNDKLHDEMNDAGFYSRKSPDTGELYWSRF